MHYTKVLVRIKMREGRLAAASHDLLISLITAEKQRRAAPYSLCFECLEYTIIARAIVFGHWREDMSDQVTVAVTADYATNTEFTPIPECYHNSIGLPSCKMPHVSPASRRKYRHVSIGCHDFASSSASGSQLRLSPAAAARLSRVLRISDHSPLMPLPVIIKSR